MRFITEDELRDIYKRQPFTDYTPASGERLTPGARQFLLDRGIDIYSKQLQKSGRGAYAGAGAHTAEKNRRKYLCRLKQIKIRFFLAAEDLLERDACIANQVMELSKQLSALTDSLADNSKIPDLPCNECTGIKQENFSECIGDCFSISEFYMQTKKGHEIMIMAELRALLEELLLEEDFPGDVDEKKEFPAKLNQIVNRLSQLICGALGGSECLRN